MAVVYDDQPAAPKSRIVYDDAPPAAAPEMNPIEHMGRNLDAAIKGSALYGAADIAGSGLMKLGGKVGAGYAGLGTMLANALGLTEAHPADVVNSVRDATNVQPTSPGAQTIGEGARVVAKPFQAVAAPLDRAIDNAGPGVRTFAPAVSEAAQDIASILPLGQAARAAKAADAAAVVEGAAKPSVGDGVGTVRGAGYKALPSDVEARMGPRATTGQGVVESTGGAGLRRDIQLHNQGQTNTLAAEDMRIPNKPKLTPQDFDTAREPHHQTYTDTGNMADLSKPSSKVQQALQNVVDDETMQGKVQPGVRNDIKQIQARMASGTYTGAQAIKDISTFRKKGVPQVANALEDEVGDSLAASGKADQAAQLEKFRDARTQLAKIKNYQDSSTGGVIDAQDFKRLSEKSPHLLTGNAKIIAQAGAELPGLTRIPTAARPPSALDKVLGFSKVATVIPKVAEVVAGKVGTSQMFQGKFGREMTPTEKSYVPGYGRKPGPLSEALTLKAPPGTAGGPPRQGGLSLPPGREPAPQMDLIPPEGEVGVHPSQIGMQLAQGRPAAPRMDLAPPEGAVGVTPSQLGMQVAQGRPIDEQRLGLKHSEGQYESHQPSLLGKEGTPEGGSRKPKAKKRGKD